MVESKTNGDALRVAAMADIHYGKASAGALVSVFSELNSRCDVLLLCGDLTDYGLPEEAELLVKDLNSSLQVPIIGVLGNHDFESGRADEVRQVLTAGRVSMLDGETCEVQGIGFIGIKGFGGGFGKYVLTPWGEPIIKAFVQETLNEALKLESGLAKMRNPQRVVLMHYSPIQATVEGEAPEIFPFCGSSRLEEPVNRFQVAAVFHGHAHHGHPEGRSTAGVPVYNVALPVLKRAYPDLPPYCIFEVPIEIGADADTMG